MQLRALRYIRLESYLFVRCQEMSLKTISGRFSFLLMRDLHSVKYLAASARFDQTVIRIVILLGLRFRKVSRNGIYNVSRHRRSV